MAGRMGVCNVPQRKHCSTTQTYLGCITTCQDERIGFTYPKSQFTGQALENTDVTKIEFFASRPAPTKANAYPRSTGWVQELKLDSVKHPDSFIMINRFTYFVKLVPADTANLPAGPYKVETYVHTSRGKQKATEGRLEVQRPASQSLAAPHVEFTFSSDFLTVEFDASQSTALHATGRNEDVGIATYEWDFGDGQSLVTDTPNATHVYEKEGDYVVTLTVFAEKDNDDDPCEPLLFNTVKHDLCLELPVP